MLVRKFSWFESAELLMASAVMLDLRVNLVQIAPVALAQRDAGCQCDGTKPGGTVSSESVSTNRSKPRSYGVLSVAYALMVLMAKIFYCGGLSGRLGTLRAVIPISDLSRVLPKENARYVGKSFPKMEQTDPQSIVIEVAVGEEHRHWRVGFYRALKGPSEFDVHLQAL